MIYYFINIYKNFKESYFRRLSNKPSHVINYIYNLKTVFQHVSILYKKYRRHLAFTNVVFLSVSILCLVFLPLEDFWNGFTIDGYWVNLCQSLIDSLPFKFPLALKQQALLSFFILTTFVVVILNLIAAWLSLAVTLFLLKLSVKAALKYCQGQWLLADFYGLIRFERIPTTEERYSFYEKACHNSNLDLDQDFFYTNIFPKIADLESKELITSKIDFLIEEQALKNSLSESVVPTDISWLDAFLSLPSETWAAIGSAPLEYQLLWGFSMLVIIPHIPNLGISAWVSSVCTWRTREIQEYIVYFIFIWATANIDSLDGSGADPDISEASSDAGLDPNSDSPSLPEPEEK